MKALCRRFTVLGAVFVGHMAVVFAAGSGRTEPAPLSRLPDQIEICFLPPCLTPENLKILGADKASSDIAAGRILRFTFDRAMSPSRSLVDEVERKDWAALGLTLEHKSLADLPECGRADFVQGYAERAARILGAKLGHQHSEKIERHIQRYLSEA
jgi:hypothetical protein